MSLDECQKGLGVLEAISHWDAQLTVEQADVTFEKVTLEGYGPFTSKVEYTLCDQSVRVVTGRNFDDPGCLSNGAGKTALVMAPMWALTGSTEARSVGGTKASSLTNAEVVNDKMKHASVELFGTVNGCPFYLKRQVGRKTLKLLQFEFDGKDLTCQESKLTQEKIDRLFNTELLAKIVFHGQHTVEKLLGSRDKEFKDELGRLVALGLWESAKDYTFSQLRQCKADIEKLFTELEVSERNHAAFQAKVNAARQDHVRWEDEAGQRLAFVNNALNQAEDELCQAAAECGAAISTYYDLREEHNSNRAEDTVSAEDLLASDLQLKIDELEMELNNQREEIMYTKARIASLSAAATSQWKRFENLHDMLPGNDTAHCSQCMQPISNASFEHASSTFKREAEQAELAAMEVKLKLEGLEVAQNLKEEEIKRCKEELQQRREQREKWVREYEQQRFAKQKTIISADICAEKGQELLECLQECTKDRGTSFLHSLTEESDFDTAVGNVVELVDLLQLKHEQWCELKRQVQSLESTTSPHKEKILSLESLLVESEERIHDITDQKESKEKDLETLTAVDLSFSRTGIQNFLLEGVLQELQSKTAKFLEVLSSGTLRLLLNPTRPSKTKQGAAMERIDKTVEVWAGGHFVSRSLKSLSGGEQRRVALALSLAFSELGSERSNTRSNMLVLDEPFQHLDLEGCQRATSLLKSLHFRTVLLVSQAFDSGTAGIDRTDCVVKKDGVSFLESV